MYQFEKLICRSLTSITQISWVPSRYKQKIRQLYFLADLDSLDEFEKFIKVQLECSPDQIQSIFDQLYCDSYFRESLGQKLIVLVLKIRMARVIKCQGQYHYYYPMGNCTCFIKRAELDRIYTEFCFQTSSLNDLILLCSQKLGYDKLELERQVKQSQIDQEDINRLFQEQIKTSVDQFAFQKQMFRNLQQDYYSSAERSIQKILFKQILIAFIQANLDLIADSKLDVQPEFMDAQLDLQSLQETLRQSQSIHPKDEQDINNIFQKIKEHKERSYDYLIALKHIILPINIFQLQRLVNKNHQIYEMIRNINGILMMGTTKSGKTTSCLKFLGVGFKQSQSFKLVPTGLKHSQRQFITTPLRPCTKSFNAALLPSQIYGTQYEDYYIIDTPGFISQNHCSKEVQLSMKYSIPKLVSALKTVRIVLIVSYNDLIGSKKEIIKIAQYFSDFFYSTQQLQNLSIYFNQVPREQIEYIPDQIQTAYNSVMQRQNYNQKILSFFELLEKRSLQINSYLYPFQNDCKTIVKEIISNPPVDKLNSKFYFDSISSTKLSVQKSLNLSQMRYSYYKSNIWRAEMKMQNKNVQKLKQIIEDNQSQKVFKEYQYQKQWGIINLRDIGLCWYILFSPLQFHYGILGLEDSLQFLQNSFKGKQFELRQLISKYFNKQIRLIYLSCLNYKLAKARLVIFAQNTQKLINQLQDKLNLVEISYLPATQLRIKQVSTNITIFAIWGRAIINRISQINSKKSQIQSLNMNIGKQILNIKQLTLSCNLESKQTYQSNKLTQLLSKIQQFFEIYKLIKTYQFANQFSEEILDNDAFNNLQNKKTISQTIQIMLQRIIIGLENLNEITKLKELIRQKANQMRPSQLDINFDRLLINNTCYSLQKQFLEILKKTIINDELKDYLKKNPFIGDKFFILKEKSQQFFKSSQIFSQEEIVQILNRQGRITEKNENQMIKALNILRAKKWKFIQQKTGKEMQIKLTELIQKQLKKAKQNCTRKMKNLLDTIKANKKIIKKIKQSINAYQKMVKRQSSERYEQLKGLISQAYNDKIFIDSNLENIYSLSVEKKNMLIGIQNQIRVIQREKINDNNQQFNQKLSRINQSFHQILQNFVQSLINYQKTIIETRYLTKKNHDFLDSILDYFSKENQLIQLIYQALLQSKGPNRVHAAMILKTHQIFNKYVQSDEQSPPDQDKIDQIIQSISRKCANGNNPLQNEQKSIISQAYSKYKHLYDKYKGKYEKYNQNQFIEQIITVCKDLGEKLKHQRQEVTRQQKIKLLAGICAVYAMKNTQVIEQKVKWLIQPKPVQILSIMSLLGILNQKQQLKNDLIQISVGQEKGFVFSMLSIYQALSGFNVNYINQSIYLCEEYQKRFEEMFLLFSVQSKIKYGTYKEICERMIQKKSTALQQQFARELSKDCLKFQKQNERYSTYFAHKEPIQNSQPPSLLLIDQPKNIFINYQLNELYCPKIKLRDKKISQFIHFIWSRVSQIGESISVEEVIDSTYYKNIVERFPSIQELLYNQVSGMIAGALQFKHQYFIIDNKIVYEKDNQNSDINFGYKTVFANIYEYEQNRVSKGQLNQALCIELTTAQLSLGIIPRFFDLVLAITSNYDDIPIKQKKNIADLFGIQQLFSILPKQSSNTTRITENYMVVSQNKMKKEIIEKIKQSQNRPCFIFFNSMVQLNQLFNSQQYQPYQIRSSIISQSLDPIIRNGLLVQSTFQNTITLMTSAFGRDILFYILDQQIQQKRGISIIQTFLAGDQFEQNRIKSKNIKNDYPVSYHCIINQNELAVYGLKFDENLRKVNSDIIYNILSQARENFNLQALHYAQALNDFTQKQEKALQLIQYQFSQRKLIEYLQLINLFPQINKLKIKIILAVNSIGFMTDLIVKMLKETVSQIFSSVLDNVQKQKLKISLNMKIIVNNDCLSTQMVSQTPYQNDPKFIKRFLSKIKLKRGLISLSDQALLSALGQEQSADQIILISGSNPETFKDNIIDKQQGYSIRLIDLQCKQPLSVDQILKLSNKLCLIQAVPLERSENYENEDNEIKGRLTAFNITSRNASEKFKKLIIESILTAIYQKSGLNNLKPIIKSNRKQFR